MSLHSFVTSAALIPHKILAAPSAWLGHIPFGAWLVQASKPKILVELGTHYGHSYFAFCESVSFNKLPTLCYAVDTWKGDPHSGEYGPEVYDFVLGYSASQYRDFSSLLRMEFDEAVDRFSNNTIDLLHIDGLHTYEAVRHDFETWLPKLSERAIVVFHDTNVRKDDFGVWRLWEEVSLRYPSIHFEHSYGLGVIFVGSKQSADIKELLKDWADSKERKTIQLFFFKLGRNIQNEWELSSLKKKIDAEQKSNTVQADLDKKNEIIHSLRNVIGILEVRISKLHSRNLQSIGHIQTLKDEARENDRKLQACATKLTEEQNKVQAIYQSKSWRITHPLRRLVATVRAFKNMLSTTLRRSARAGPANFVNPAEHSNTSDISTPERKDYIEWVKQYETLNDTELSVIQKHMAGFQYRPILVILLWSADRSPTQLAQTVDSIHKQDYVNWKLCIVSDDLTSGSDRIALERYTKMDSRITIISEVTGSQTNIFSGTIQHAPEEEWIILMDTHGLLADHALFWIADAINQHPDSELVYSDEDQIDEAGNRSNPHFKSDWNLELFYSGSFIRNFCVYRKNALTQLLADPNETFRPTVSNLVLRYLERFRQAHIHHIPRILFHSERHVDSNRISSEELSLKMAADQKSLNDHLSRQQLNAYATPADSGLRITFSLPSPEPSVCLIIPTRNESKLLRQCIDSIINKTNYSNYEILIIDNGSDDPASREYFNYLNDLHQNVRIIRDDRPFNYSALNNTAAKATEAELLGLINNDIEVISPDWLEEMVSHAIRPGIGAVGARLWYPDDTLQHGGVVLGLGGRRLAGHSHRLMPRGSTGYFDRANSTQEYSAVTAACMVIKKTIYDEVGGLNETDLQVAYNDVDFCLRVKEKGYRNIWTPYADLYHHESASRGMDDTDKKRIRYDKEIAYFRHAWGDKLLNDPFYNPNLSLDHPDFSLAWPPRLNPLT